MPTVCCFYYRYYYNMINVVVIIIPGFLKTGLAKISTHSTSWQFKTIKLVQRPIKSVYLTPASKLMVPRSIPTSPNLNGANSRTFIQKSDFAKFHTGVISVQKFLS